MADIGQTTATTGVIRVNGVVASTLETGLDQDWFRVAGLVAGRTYQIDLVGFSSGLGTLFDPLIFGVFTAGGSFIANTISGDLPDSLDDSLDFTPTVNGTHYINASNADDLSIGTYVLAITDLSAPDLAATAATTGTVALGAAGVQGIIDIAGDSDWYKVSLQKGSIYRITMTGLDGLGGTLSDTVIQGVRSPGGTLIPFTANDDANGGVSSQVEFMATTTGTHFIDVAGYPGFTGTFNLRVENVTPQDILGGTGTNVTLTVNAAEPHLNRIGPPGDVDWFRVQLTAGVAYRIEGLGIATGHGSHEDPRITGIYNSVGTLVAAGNDDGGLGRNARLSFTPTTTGTYYVGIDDPRATDVPGLYRVSVTTGGFHDLPANAATPAQALVGGSVLGTVDTANDVDWFRAVLLPGRTYTISLTGHAGEGAALADPFLRGLYYGDGTLIPGTSNDDFAGSTNSQVTFTSPGGTVFIAAGGYGAGTGNYNLTVQDVTPADLAANTTTLGTITAGGQRTGRIDLAGDQDWFKVTLAAGTYVVDLEGNPSSPLGLYDPFFRGVYNSNGTLRPGTTNDDFGETFNSRVTFSVAAGTYYLAAGGFGEETGDYVLTLTSVGNVTDDFTSTTATTGTVAVNGAAMAGRIDSAFDEDWFRVTLNAGQAYVIDLRGQPSGNGTLLDPRFVGIYNSGGVLIPGTGNDDANGSRDSQVFFTPTVTGTYYLAAGGYGSDAGTYKISVATTNLGTDVAANTTTTASVVVGTPGYLGTVNFAGDVDWVKVNVTAGGSYVTTLRGAPSGAGTLADPEILGIFDQNGQALLSAIEIDQVNPASQDSRATFSAGYTGSAFIAVRAENGGTGTYRLGVSAATDNAAPTLASTSPADSALNVARNANITLSFSEAVKAGAGNITITGGGQTRTISVTDATQVTFSGETMTINPTADLAASTAYTVTMGAGVVKDLAGNNFAGLNNTQLNFATGSAAPAADKWTIMVYMDGDNNLEQFALSDLNEMEAIAGLNAVGVNIMVMTDRIGGYSSASGNWTDTRRGQVIPDGNTTTATTLANATTSVGEKNMGQGATLTEFINWAAGAAPAQHYALIIWDHGGGLNGAAWDDSNGNDFLSVGEMQTAIDASNIAKFDIIGYDCCQMAMAEMAFALRNLTDVFVASQENEPGDGWDYDAFLAQLKANPTMSDTQLATAIVNTYAAQYAGQSDITLSALTTAQLAIVETRLDTFVTVALAASASDKAAMTAAAQAAVQFPSDGSAPWRDLVDFMEEIMARTTTAALDNAALGVINAVRGAVFAEAGSVPDAEGLSINLPTGGPPADYTGANYSFLNSVAWDDFLAII